MGIPVYFKSILQTYPDVIEMIPESVDYLSFDLNCAIHPCCRNLSDESKMRECLFEKIKECIQLTKVKKQIYFAIDGPAPRMKMEQQRQRRLKSKSTLWDTNAITPGTQFMEDLHLYLNKQLPTLQINYILSDSDQPGEGEHKLMKWIDSTEVSSTHMVYGLDADLIMLSMLRKQSIHLLRERTEYNLEETEDKYVSLNISKFQSHLYDYLSVRNVSKQQVIYDYICMCFLLGNDFLPPIPTIQLRYKGHERLLFVYRKLQENYSGCFYIYDSVKKQLHVPYFKVFLHELTKYEYDDIQQFIQIRKKQEQSIKRRFSKLSHLYIQGICDKNHPQWEEFECHIPLFHREEEIRCFQTKIHKPLYYMKCLYPNEEWSPAWKSVLQEGIKQMCQDYLSAYLWTVSYYFDECISWKWYSPHIYAPLISDVSSYVSSKETFDFLKKDSTPYTPEEQLCLVLPRHSHNLIRSKKKIQPEEYYPVSAPSSMFLKRYLWECHPWLPHYIGTTHNIVRNDYIDSWSPNL